MFKLKRGIVGLRKFYLFTFTHHVASCATAALLLQCRGPLSPEHHVLMLSMYSPCGALGSLLPPLLLMSTKQRTMYPDLLY